MKTNGNSITNLREGTFKQKEVFAFFYFSQVQHFARAVTLGQSFWKGIWQ